MSENTDPFLLQKLEFLESELQESKERETKLKKTYDSLLTFINSTKSNAGDQTESELGKVSEAYQRELEEVKKKGKDEKDRLEDEGRTLRKRLKELELDLKQAAVTAEREKLEMRQKVTQLEADKQALHCNLKGEEEERHSGIQESERRNKTLAQQLQDCKSTATKEKERILSACEAKIGELMNSHGLEETELRATIARVEETAVKQREKINTLKSECDSLRSELRRLHEENSQLRSGHQTKRYKDQVEEEKQRLLTQVQSLQGKIQSFTVRQSGKSDLKPRNTPREYVSDRPATEISMLRAQVSKGEKTIELLKTELAEERKRRENQQTSPRLGKGDERPLQVSNSLSTVRQSRLDDSLLVDKFKDQLLETSQELAEARDQLRESKVETAQLQLQKERLQIDLEKMRIESKQGKLDWSVDREKLLDEIRKLKTESKFLIGKLVKAKGKLAVEGELNETLRKEGGVSDSFRSKSVNKVRLSARGASPSRHCVSPLNLSGIARAGSPGMTQSIDAI